jgi:hypothetical protein
MAIQVSGTQVIGNSRELTNIASIDATTATAIGNAGVGGTSWNQVGSTLTQSAQIGTGQNVVLTATIPSFTVVTNMYVYFSAEVQDGNGYPGVYINIAAAGQPAASGGYRGISYSNGGSGWLSLAGSFAWNADTIEEVSGAPNATTPNVLPRVAVGASNIQMASTPSNASPLTGGALGYVMTPGGTGSMGVSFRPAGQVGGTTFLRNLTAKLFMKYS